MPRRPKQPGIRERTLPDGRKRYDVRIEYPPDPLTQQRRTPSKTFPSLEEAQRYQRRQLTDHDNGIVIAPERVTVAELCHRWLEEEAAHRVRATTLEDYAGTVRVHLLPRIGAKRAQSLTPSDVAALRSSMLQETGTRTTQLALARLKQVLSWGVSIELLKRNVAQGVKPPRDRVEERRALSHAEARAFLEIAETDHYS